MLDVDGIIFSPRKESNLVVLSARENRELAKLLQKNKGDILGATAALSDKGMLVAAMDMWRAYFEKYPDDNDLRPLLAESYAQLRLENLRHREARLYQSQAGE